MIMDRLTATNIQLPSVHKLPGLQIGFRDGFLHHPDVNLGKWKVTSRLCGGARLLLNSHFSDSDQCSGAFKLSLSRWVSPQVGASYTHRVRNFRL